MTRTLRYAVLDPTGNITLLVETPVPTAEQPDAAARLMALEPAAEQAGFLSETDRAGIALRMAGGEFCGNAAMSAAVLKADGAGLERARLQVAVSGTDRPVTAAVERADDGSWRGTVSMPRPVSARRETLPDGKARPVIRFGGITHVLLDDETPDRERAGLTAPLWCRALDARALGMLFRDTAAGTMTPLVYVPDAGTLCWENSCASGTAAVGAYLAAQTGRAVRVSLRQPGGTLTVEAGADGALSLFGRVRILRRGTAQIN